MSDSPKYQLSKEDLRKVFVGFGVAIGGAAITYFADLVPKVDFGQWTPVVVAIASVLVNVARKLLSGPKP